MAKRNNRNKKNKGSKRQKRNNQKKRQDGVEVILPTTTVLPEVQKLQECKDMEDVRESTLIDMTNIQECSEQSQTLEVSIPEELIEGTKEMLSIMLKYKHFNIDKSIYDSIEMNGTQSDL